MDLLSTSLSSFKTHDPWEISTAYLTMRFFKTHDPWEISTAYLTMSNPTQPIIAKTCNSIIQTILLIVIISYRILCKVITFENYTHTHCGLFNHTIQHQYCALFGHTIQHMKVWFTEENIYPNASFLKFCSACLPRASKNNSHRKWARKYFTYEVSINSLVLDFLYN